MFPDVTKIQVIGIVKYLIAIAVALGAPISDEESAALITVSGLVAGILFHEDAKIRGSRNDRAARESLHRSLSNTKLDEEVQD